MTRAGPHKDTWTRPGESRRHPVLSLTNHQTKDGRTPSSEASSQASFIIGLKTEFPRKLILAWYDCDPVVTRPLSRLWVSAAHPVLISGPAPQWDPAVCSLQLTAQSGKHKNKRIDANCKQLGAILSSQWRPGVEPGWFAFQWTLTILVWYHLILICDPSKQKVTSWILYLLGLLC